MKPSYAPGAGSEPCRDTEIVWLAPAASCTLGVLTVTCAFDSAVTGRTAILKVAAALLTFVITRVRVTGRADGTGPNEIAAGSSVAATATASAALSLPAPTSVT